MHVAFAGFEAVEAISLFIYVLSKKVIEKGQQHMSVRRTALNQILMIHSYWHLCEDETSHYPCVMPVSTLRPKDPALKLLPMHHHHINIRTYTLAHKQPLTNLPFSTSHLGKSTMVDKITPNDSRIKRLSADLNGQTYAYIESSPSSTPIATIFLIHGWPDLSFGWRYQIPFLTSLGYRVIAPDMMGYGGSSAPESSSFYTFKRAADDIAALAKHIGVSQIILGGHDWGGAIVYRVAIHYPELISALFSVCTPFFPPKKELVSMSVASNFKYQIQLKGPDVEREIVGEKKLRQFLNAMYGGIGPNGEFGFSVGHGVFFENLDKLRPSRMVSGEELDFYAKEYAKHGMHGPLNWYRTEELNFEDERGLVGKFEEGEGSFKFEIPTLFIASSRDDALPPKISLGMDKYFKKLTRAEVDTSHWALTEKPVEVNGHLKEWLEEVMGVSKKASL